MGRNKCLPIHSALTLTLVHVSWATMLGNQNLSMFQLLPGSPHRRYD